MVLKSILPILKAGQPKQPSTKPPKPKAPKQPKQPKQPKTTTGSSSSRTGGPSHSPSIGGTATGQSAQGQPCKPGQNPKTTGCKPASETEGSPSGGRGSTSRAKLDTKLEAQLGGKKPAPKNNLPKDEEDVPYAEEVKPEPSWDEQVASAKREQEAFRQSQKPEGGPKNKLPNSQKTIDNHIKQATDYLDKHIRKLGGDDSDVKAYTDSAKKKIAEIHTNEKDPKKAAAKVNELVREMARKAPEEVDTFGNAKSKKPKGWPTPLPEDKQPEWDKTAKPREQTANKSGQRHAGDLGKEAHDMGIDEATTRKIQDWVKAKVEEVYSKVSNPKDAERILDNGWKRVREQMEELSRPNMRPNKSLGRTFKDYGRSWSLPWGYIFKGNSLQGKPCGRGQSAARTGCTPRGGSKPTQEDKPQRPSNKKEVNLSELASSVKDLAKKGDFHGVVSTLAGYTVAQLDKLAGHFGIKIRGNKDPKIQALADQVKSILKEGGDGKQGPAKDIAQASTSPLNNQEDMIAGTEPMKPGPENRLPIHKPDALDETLKPSDYKPEGRSPNKLTPEHTRPEEIGHERGDIFQHPGRGEGIRGGAEAGSDEVEGKIERPDYGSPDQIREAESHTVDKAVARGIPRKRAERVAADAGEVNKRIDRFEKLFRSRGNERVADLLGSLRSHFNEVGVQAALDGLGEEVEGEGESEVGYTASEYWHESMGEFTTAYLNRHGIMQVSETQEGSPIVAPGTDTYSDFTPTHQPTETPYNTKLDEAKDLPGLEKTEDLSVVLGGKEGEPVHVLGVKHIEEIDNKYGKGNWIMKTYGDDAFAGQGIFFPQRIAKLIQESRDTMWNSGAELSKYGFSHLRDEKTGEVIGIKHQGGDEYPFGSDKYNHVIQGEAKRWGDEAARVAKDENGLKMPNEGKQFMIQPAFPVIGVSEEERAQGKTIVKGEGRVHVVVKNGKAEIIPHSTWLKGEPLPVVFENEETKSMAKAAQEAIDALPEKARAGQLYAPDIVRTKDGYKVVELNASVSEGGGSGYLQDNPFIIDAYVSHVTGREPGHVKFIRNLLSKKVKQAKRLRRQVAKSRVVTKQLVSRLPSRRF